jgi:outer membrane lipoprotein carrier protein
MQNTFENPSMINHSTCQLVKKSLKKFALAGLLLPLFSISPFTVYAADSTVTASGVQAESAKQRLMTKLSKLAFFSADFSQKIINNKGEMLQDGGGTLAISKPNLVNWKTTSPDETLIISDGNTLWFYDPFIEQASAYSLAKSIHNTPILLLTSDEPLLWQQYQVKQEDQRFIVIPNDPSSQIKQLTLGFSGIDNSSVDSASSNNVQLSEFSFQDATGQISHITLSNFNSQVKPDAALFTFTLPDGVRLEDKR